MNKHPLRRKHDCGQARVTNLNLVQHNSLGSWDVFLSLFNSFVEFSPVDIVLLQDLPVYHGSLPSFAGFKAFAPPVPKPRVACYVALGFCRKYTLLPAFVPQMDDVMFLDIFTPEGFFDFSATKFRIGNVYSRSLAQPPTHTVTPATALADYDFPYLVAGDFNIHNPASGPLRVISCTEERALAPYFDQATDLEYTLLNTPGVFTCYPLSGEQRPSVIDLAFANPLMFPAFRSWDATSLPSTGSDHVPIVIKLASPSQNPPPPRPKWDETDWPSLEALLRFFTVSPPPFNPSPRQLDHWFSSTINVLTALVKSATPTPRPSLHSKPWWTPLLTTLRKEYSKAVRVGKKSHKTLDQQAAKHSRNGYFKAIKRAKPPTGHPSYPEPPRKIYQLPKSLSHPGKPLGSPPSQKPTPPLESTKPSSITPSP